MSPENGDIIKVLLIDDIAETRENLRKLLSFDPQIEVVGAARSGAEGINLAKQFKPDIVIMDINMPEMDGITATEKLLQAVPTAQVVMLSVQGETDYVRRAMLAGARDFLTKPPSGDELMNTIRRVYEKGKTRIQQMPTGQQPTGSSTQKPGSETDRREGHVIGIFGPKGGVGCTTVAANLAVALKHVLGSTKKVALLDANLQFGGVEVMLNIRSKRSIADLTVNPEDLDSDMLNSILSSHGSGIKVLLAPPSPELADSFIMEASQRLNGMEKTRFGFILSRLQEEFDVVVVDLWRRLDDITLTVFDAATTILLLTTPTIPSIKNARSFLEIAAQVDYPIQLVVNQTDRRTGIRSEQIEQAMIPITVEIPKDDQAALSAANHGVPFFIKDRSRPISQSILQLAEHIRDTVIPEEEEPQEEPQEDTGGTGLLRLREVFDRKA